MQKLYFKHKHLFIISGKVKGERTFGFSFIKLLKDDGTVIRDGSYSMYIYKVFFHLKYPNTAHVRLVDFNNR